MTGQFPQSKGDVDVAEMDDDKLCEFAEVALERGAMDVVDDAIDEITARDLSLV